MPWMLDQSWGGLSPQVAKQALSPDPFAAGLGAQLLRIPTVQPNHELCRDKGKIHSLPFYLSDFANDFKLFISRARSDWPASGGGVGCYAFEATEGRGLTQQFQRCRSLGKA